MSRCLSVFMAVSLDSVGVEGKGTEELTGAVLPVRQQAALDDLAGPTLERARALGDAVARAHVELPLVLGAGERAALQGEVGDVRGLVRAAAVVDAPFLFGAVHEEAAAVAFRALRVADLETCLLYTSRCV